MPNKWAASDCSSAPCLLRLGVGQGSLTLFASLLDSFLYSRFDLHIVVADICLRELSGSDVTTFYYTF